MAIAVTINFTFTDDKGKASKTEIKVPTGFTIAQYQEFAEAAAQLIADLSDGALTSASIAFAIDLSGAGLKAVAAAVSKVARKMFGIFNTAGGIIAKWFIPASHDTQVVSGSDDFDQSDVAVAPVITAMEDGIVVTGGTMQFTNGRGHDITGTASLKEVFRRRRP